MIFIFGVKISLLNHRLTKQITLTFKPDLQQFRKLDLLPNTDRDPNRNLLYKQSSAKRQLQSSARNMPPSALQISAIVCGLSLGLEDGNGSVPRIEFERCVSFAQSMRCANSWQ